MTEKTLSRCVDFLCDSLCDSRATGTPGAVEAAMWIQRQMREEGMETFSLSFPAKPDSSVIGHNVIGLSSGWQKGPERRYIIVGAHFDNIPTINGKTHPGADSNASGVAALLNLAHMLKSMKTLGKTYKTSVLFVAFDAKDLSMAGSRALMSTIEKGLLTDPETGLAITKERIVAMVNLDILGSTLAPLKSGRPDYMLMLSGGRFVAQLNSCNNTNPRLKMDLCFDYYGSAGFTRIFYNRIGDQKVFLDAGIPAVLFTSGITMKTNKEDDIPSSLDYSVLKKRVWLIYHWLDRLM
ncbi:MAG: M28 family peptidase [Bacteroidales bacterium]|nr:M28 family peptidase [Bacteroidales bacterium]